MDERDEDLLQALLATVARNNFPPDELVKLISPVAGMERQLLAYNLCNGRTAQTEISRQANLDRGNFSRTIARWVEEGIAFRVGQEQFPLHLYPLPKRFLRATKKAET